MVKLLVALTVILSTHPTESEPADCRNLDAFTYCGSSGVLTFVNQTRQAETLRLNLHRFSKIAPDAFHDLRVPRLAVSFNVELANPRIVDIEPGSFRGLDGLTSLHIELGIFSVAPSPFGLLKNLTDLSFYACGFTEIPHEFFPDFPLLSVFNLVNNNITTLTGTSFAGINENIREIGLEENNISNIDGRPFRKLRSLKILSLSDNKLRELPPGIFQGLHQLRQLNLNDNQLSVLRNNSFEDAEQLERLELNHNEIREIEPGAFWNSNIRDLGLSGNRLVSLEPGAFRGLRRLGSLDLRFNKIAAVSGSVFVGLLQLEELRLDHNEITNIDVNSFSGLNLTILGLRDNRLRLLDVESFGNLSVVTLDLRENEILEIGPGFRSLPMKNILLAAGNTISNNQQ